MVSALISVWGREETEGPSRISSFFRLRQLASSCVPLSHLKGSNDKSSSSSSSKRGKKRGRFAVAGEGEEKEKEKEEEEEGREDDEVVESIMKQSYATFAKTATTVANPSARGWFFSSLSRSRTTNCKTDSHNMKRESEFKRDVSLSCSRWIRRSRTG